MTINVRHQVTIEVPDVGEVTLEATAFVTPGHRGYTSGPPERCYPSEPDDIEWSTFVVVSPEGKGLSFDADDVDLLLAWERFASDIEADPLTMPRWRLRSLDGEWPDVLDKAGDDADPPSDPGRPDDECDRAERRYFDHD